MSDIALSPSQQAAVDEILKRLTGGEKLIALKGLAGTGKTSVIPAIALGLRRRGVPVTIAAPTHRAAHILRQKGLDAETVHHEALVMYYTADYRQASRWLGEDLPVLPTDTTVPKPDVEDLPWLVYEAVKPDLDAARKLKRRRTYKARRLLTSIGVSLKAYIAGHGPKKGEGVLIVDEASMVGRKMLDDCLAAFPQVLLVGDPGQLPPVGDAPVLEPVPGVELTSIHRQAEDSPILQLAYAARRGEAFWETMEDSPLAIGAPARIVDEVAASRFNTCPLLVWQNDTRISCTKAIRKALGYKRDVLMPGEPLACKSTDPDDRALGFFNNALFRIVWVDPEDPRHVTLRDELGDETTTWIHLEELDGERPDPKLIPFRFGYVYTVHTAQGGEWPRVYISLRSLRAYKQKHPEDFQRWSYTAITRAKETLRLLTRHTFTAHHERHTAMELDTLHPSSAPPLGMDEEEANPGLTPLLPSTFPALAPSAQPEDIPDPVTPPAALAVMPHEALVPLVQGFVQFCQGKLDTALIGSTKDALQSIEDMHAYLKRLLEVDQEKVQYAKSALDVMITKMVTDGVQLRHDPYQAEIQAMSPQGYPVKLHIAKGDADALVNALPVLMGWLTEQKYKPA